MLIKLLVLAVVFVCVSIVITSGEIDIPHIHWQIKDRKDAIPPEEFKLCNGKCLKNDSNSICDNANNNECVCRVGFVYSESLGRCHLTNGPAYNRLCETLTECANVDNYAICDIDSHTCECKEGYAPSVETKNCIKIEGPSAGEPCDGHSMNCEQLDSNSFCNTDAYICECNNHYEIVEQYCAYHKVPSLAFTITFIVVLCVLLGVAILGIFVKIWRIQKYDKKRINEMNLTEPLTEYEENSYKV